MLGTQISLDIETAGTNPGCKILSIGAATFDENGVGKTAGPSTFYQAIMLDGQGGLTEDAETMVWWLNQSYDARIEVFNNPRAVPLGDALMHFSYWLAEVQSSNTGIAPPIWGNGSDFDNTIMKAAYLEMQKTWLPNTKFTAFWSHRQNRCLRTLKAMAPEIKSPNVGTAHHALHDAINQAAHAHALLHKIGIWPEK